MTLRLFALFTFLFLYGINVYCQDSTTDTLLHSNYAIAFSFSGLNLGGGVGGKYWLNKNYSLKVEINVSGSYSKTNRDLQVYPYNTETKEIDLSLVCGLSRHFSIRNNLTPYLCGFIGFGWSGDWISYIYPSFRGNDHWFDRSIIGGIGFGIEYWISQNISLSGEQTFRAEYSYQSSDRETLNIRNRTSLLILSIYI